MPKLGLGRINNNMERLWRWRQQKTDLQAAKLGLAKFTKSAISSFAENCHLSHKKCQSNINCHLMPVHIVYIYTIGQAGQPN